MSQVAVRRRNQAASSATRLRTGFCFAEVSELEPPSSSVATALGYADAFGRGEHVGPHEIVVGVAVSRQGVGWRGLRRAPNRRLERNTGQELPLALNAGEPCASPKPGV